MATTPSHQTVRLERGRHAGPDAGACVMELASMLAGERFSDHPRAVCPTIAAFLRRYNDAVDDERRAGLYPIAALVVGTRAGRRLARQRARRCRRRLYELGSPDRGHAPFGLPGAGALYAEACADAFARAGAHEEALAFVAELAAMAPADAGVPAAVPDYAGTAARPPAGSKTRSPSAASTRTTSPSPNSP